MAKFVVKASEFKNVCKAVNDRKLAELKKEIIAILKKQDSKEIKKAVEFFEAQEKHYTHLEKSMLTGKWIEKAGYGIGTVRIWKGKKYKKIAPGKWARVFEKEGRGTNIAIGKLIAKVQKIDNVEDLMDFVMANKQRFVDENGNDLPVLDKLRAAVDARNGNVGSKGTSKPADKNLYDGLSENELKKEVIKEYDKLSFEPDKKQQDIYEDIEEIKNRNGNLYEAIKEKFGENTNKVFIEAAVERLRRKDKKNDKPAESKKESTEDLQAALKEVEDAIDNAGDYDDIEELEKERKQILKKLGKKPAEKKEGDSKAYEGKLATQKQVDEATAISNKYEVSRNEMLKKPITRIQKYANSTVEDFEGGIDKFIEYMAEGRSEGVSMNEVGKEFAKLINHNVARKIWDDYESGALVPDENGILKPKEESEAENAAVERNILPNEQAQGEELPGEPKTLSKKDMENLADEIGEINHQELFKKITTEEQNKKYEEVYKKYFPIEPKIIQDERNKWLSRVDDEITDETVKSGEEQAKKMNDGFLMEKIEQFRNIQPLNIEKENEQEFKFWVLNHVAKRASKMYVNTLDDAMEMFNIPYNAKTENYNKRKKLGLSILEKEAEKRGLDVKETKTQEDYEKEYEQSLKGKNDAETLDNIVEAYDKVAAKLRTEAKAKGMNPNELNDPELEALGKLRLEYSEKNISEGEKKYREELEKLSGRMKDAINNEFGYEEESEAEKTQNRSEAMKGNKNAYKGGLAKDTVKFVKEVKGEPYHDFETDTNKLAIYSDDGRRSSGIVMSQEIADIIDSHNEPSILDWKDNIADEINAKYPAIQKDYVRLALGGIRPGYRSGKKENVKVVSSDESKNVEETAKKTEPKDEPKKTSAYKAGKPATSDPEKLKPIAKSESVGEGKVKLPYSKEVSEEIKALTNSIGKDQGRYSSHDFLTKVYYDKGNLVATDGRCMKVVKVGELEGIDNGSYVDIDNSKDGITITANKEFSKEHKFPLYERVIPKDNNEKIVLDNKALLAKIKDLKKDGSLKNKDPWVTFDIQGNDLMLDGVKVGDVSAANFKGDDSNYFNINANYLANYLSGDYSELMSSQNNENAMYIGNDSAINVIMPQTKYEYKRDSDGNEKRELRRKDYDSLRESKRMEDEEKANKKTALKASNKEYVDDIIKRYKSSVPADFEEKSIKKMQDWSVEALERLYKVANSDIDSMMDKKDFNSNNFSSYTNKIYNMSPGTFIGQNYAMKEHPAIVRETERLIKEKGGKIEKSLFDDFIVDVFEVEDEEENESLFNDYSAEQPELFNSTTFKVQEALNRRYNCL